MVESTIQSICKPKSADLVPVGVRHGTEFKQTIYQSLDSDFDDYLVHQKNLERILNAIHQPYPQNKDLYDDRLQVQKSIMKIIGRLNTVNAAETMPQASFQNFADSQPISTLNKRHLAPKRVCINLKTLLRFEI